MVEFSLFLIFIAYAFVLLAAVIGIQGWKAPKVAQTNPKIGFSIVIPFRNEADNLPQLLQSLKQLDGTSENFEIILINDHSDDAFEDLINPFKSNLDFQLLHLEQEKGKKRAIQAGVYHSKYDYIITLDADCQVPENLLISYAHLIIEQKYDLIIGSVSLTSSSKFVEQFQFLDFLAMQGVSLGWANWNHPILCSGANLCYSKIGFMKLQPFDGNWHLSSGDDVFTLLAFKRKKMNIGVNFSAVVISKSLSTWKALFHQRVRWLSKNFKISDGFYTLISGVIFVTNLSLLVMLVFCFYDLSWLEYFFIFFVSKFLLDYFLLYKIGYQLYQNFCWQTVLKVSLIYPLVLTLTFLSRFNLKYIWKNRIYNDE